MSFSISNFESNFQDLARQYQFHVKALGPITSKDIFETLVVSTVLPQRNVTAIDAKFMGHQYKLAGDVEYPDWTCTFRVKSDYTIYKEMRTWQEIPRSKGEDNIVIGNWRDYKSTVELDQLDNTGNSIGTLKLIGVWPSGLGEITYDTQTSEVQTFAVTFTYDYHTWA